MRIGHISDLHVLHLEDVNPLDFASKRLVGGINLLRHRADAHSVEVARHALARLSELDVDHICISGDMTNLALPSEFRAASKLVAEIPDAETRVSVVPGNHDYYTHGAARERRFEHHFQPYLRSDLPAYQESTGYPFVHFREDVAIIGMNSGVPTPPLMAWGKVPENELRALDALLSDPKLKDCFKVFMIHHPLLPFQYAKVQESRHLVNATDVLKVLREHQVDLAIHGHNHHFSVNKLPHLNGSGDLYICEAGSTSNRASSLPEFAGSFNIFEIEDRELVSIETHIYDGFEDTFVHWKEEVFRRVLV